jgi:hypothetical protein
MPAAAHAYRQSDTGPRPTTGTDRNDLPDDQRVDSGESVRVVRSMGRQPSAARRWSRLVSSKATKRIHWTRVGVARMVATAIRAAYSDGKP